MMKVLKRIEVALLVCVLFPSRGGVCLEADGGVFQRQATERPKPADWIVFSPPDGSFSINLPKAPSRTEKLNPGANDERQNFRCTNSLLAAYRFPLQADAPEFEFVIGVFDVSGCKRTPEDFKQETEGIVRLFADDDNDRVISDKAMKVNRYPARVFITKTAAGNYVWDMFVDSGQRIYWLIYATDERNGHLSRKASMIFRSFDPKR